MKIDLHLRPLIAALFAIFLPIPSHSQLLIRTSDLYSPYSAPPSDIPDTLQNRTFKIPTDLLARRLNITNFSTVEDLAQLENALRRELATRRVQIPSASTNLAEKDLRIGPPSALHIRATRKDLAKIDLLLAEWQRAQIQTEILSAKLPKTLLVLLLADLPITLHGAAPQDAQNSLSFLATSIKNAHLPQHFNRPLATAVLTAAQKERLQKALTEKAAIMRTTHNDAYPGERLWLTDLHYDALLQPLAIRPTLNSKNSTTTDLTIESQPAATITSFPSFRISPNLGDPIVITTTLRRISITDPSEGMTQSIPPGSSYLILTASAPDPNTRPPHASHNATLHLITPLPVFLP